MARQYRMPEKPDRKEDYMEHIEEHIEEHTDGGIYRWLIPLLVLGFFLALYLCLSGPCRAEAAATANGSGGGDVLTVPYDGGYVDVPLESYSHYLILYDANGQKNLTRVFLSHGPLEGYAENGALYIRRDKEICTYGVSNLSGGYSGSRVVYPASGSSSLLTESYSGYASNYDVMAGNRIYLPEKPYSPPREETQPSVYDLYVRGLAYFKSIKGLDMREYPYHYIYENPGSGQVNLFIFSSEQKVVNESSFAGYPYSLSYISTPRLRLYYDGKITYLEDAGAFTADASLWSNTDLYYGDTLMSKAADFVQPSAARLYARLPEELQAYTYKIFLRQDHEDAHMNDIVFYGWNDVNAELIIRYGDSAVAAAKKGTVVEDSRTARYDLSAGQWVVEELPGTYPGRTKNLTYCVPTVFYCNSDLFIQQSGQTGWYTVRQAVRLADTEPPVTWDIDSGEWFVPGSGDPFGPGSEIEKPEFSIGFDWLDKLLDGFMELFIPRKGFFRDRLERMKGRFSFWKSISDTVGVLLDFLQDTDFSEPPKITADLSSATSRYDYGTSAVCLDMTWYAPYKPAVDKFLSAVFWLVFVYNTYRNLPNIIRGLGVASGPSGTDISGGKEGHK